MDELDIWRRAKQLIEQHGDAATIEAAIRVDAALAHGDIADVRAWRAILEAVKALRGNKRPESEHLN